MMRRKIVYALAVSAVSALTFASPAFAHAVGNPCAAAETGPGHSGFAKHHVVPLVGGPGGTEHNPGTHQGFSNCARQDA